MNRFLNKYNVHMMVIAGVATLIGIIGHHVIMNDLVAKVGFGVGTLFAGFPIVVRAIQGLKLKVVGIECLVSIALIGALFIGEWSEAAIVSFLFQFGNWLEQKTLKKTRSAIKELTEMAPAVAYDEEGNEIDVDEVEEGMILLVKTGNQIAVDGVVTRGEGHVNEASITGESNPVHKKAGDKVYAGTMMDGGLFYMEATRVGEDTTFAKIIALVEEAQDAKSPVERFIDRFAKYYTPAVVLLALVVFLVLRNVDTAITVLVLACPGALVIGAPIATVAGIGQGARNGVLLKGGDKLHAFAKSDVIMMDKTGTLTKGHPQVIRVIPYGCAENEVIQTALSLEKGSDHPLGKAIKTYAQDKDIEADTAVDVETIKGMGLKSGKAIIGNTRLFEEEKYDISEAVRKDIEEHSGFGTTVMIVGKDDKVIGLITVADPIRDEAADTISELVKAGMKHIVMLSGDNVQVAERVAQKIGIREVMASLLPEDKVEVVKTFRNDGHVVTFVGDGINDSPSLMSADIGIAMGNGTDVAIDSSDVVLIHDDLRNIVFAHRLARKTVKIMYENIAIALGTVLFLLTGLFMGYIHMGVGMLVHETSILVVIFNAMRLLGGKV